MALLEIRAVSRRFGDFLAVDQVSINIEAGEFFTLLGPSGCGKTTLLRMIAGFDAPDEGAIFLDAKNMAGIPPEARDVHTVFQSYALFPHMSVADNIAFPLKMASVESAHIEARVKEALDDVRLSGMGQRYPSELSGGQKQRVAVARALIRRPRILLLDEPLAALDAKLREQMQIELINLQREVGITFVYVTHDQGEALALSHRIAVMNLGRVVQIDEPSKIYGFPKNRFVADFIGTCNILDAVVRSSSGESATLDVEKVGEVIAVSGRPMPIGHKGALALRPEKIRLGRAVTPGAEENHCSGQVREMLYLGDVTVYIVELPAGGRIQALLPNSASGRTRFFDVGDPVEIAWRHDAGQFLDA